MSNQKKASFLMGILIIMLLNFMLWLILGFFIDTRPSYMLIPMVMSALFISFFYFMYLENKLFPPGDDKDEEENKMGEPGGNLPGSGLQ